MDVVVDLDGTKYANFFSSRRSAFPQGLAGRHASNQRTSSGTKVGEVLESYYPSHQDRLRSAKDTPRIDNLHINLIRIFKDIRQKYLRTVSTTNRIALSLRHYTTGSFTKAQGYTRLRPRYI